jgi:hypothetical protein
MSFDLTTGTAVLERTPRVLRAMLGGLPRELVRATEGPDTWSAFDVVGHLIHGDRCDWIARARMILAQGPERRFRPFDRTAMFRASQGKTLDDLLDEFASVRAENLATLAAWRLSEDQFDLTGEHPEFGTVTLRQLLATWVTHDLTHIAQITRVIAKHYGDAVGPWRTFLSVLKT